MTDKGTGDNVEKEERLLKGREDLDNSIVFVGYVNEILRRRFWDAENFSPYSLSSYMKCFARDITEDTLREESLVKYYRSNKETPARTEENINKFREELDRDFITMLEKSPEEFIENLTLEEAKGISKKMAEEKMDAMKASFHQEVQKFINRVNFAREWERLCGYRRVRVGFFPICYLQGDVKYRAQVAQNSVRAIKLIYCFAERVGGDFLQTFEETVSDAIKEMAQVGYFAVDVLFEESGNKEEIEE